MTYERSHSALAPDTVTSLLHLRPVIERVVADAPRGMELDAEDKVQVVMLRVIEHFPNYRPHQEGLKPWVTRIARNVKLEGRRKKKRRDLALGLEAVDADLVPARTNSPERTAQTRALLSRVKTAIDEMPKNWRDVLLRVEVDGVDQEQVALEYGISLGAMKMRLSRARAYLRERVGPTEDHYGVMAPVPTFAMATRASLIGKPMMFLGQVVHLLPPLLIVLHGYTSPLLVRMDDIARTSRDESIIVQHVPRKASAATRDPSAEPRQELEPRMPKRRKPTPTAQALDGALNALPADGRTVTNGH